MAYLPHFEYDIFISYSHEDNKSPFAWVDDFERALAACLQHKLTGTPGIWQDKRELMSNDYFEKVIKDKLSKVAFLIPIVSPNYLRSKWCLMELEEFCNAADRAGNLGVADRARIFKVMKSEVPLEQHPAELKGLSSHEFYGESADNSRQREFSFDSDSTHRKFMDKIGDVVYEICKMIESINEREESAQAPTTVSPVEQTTVYLAETTFDQSLARDKIKRELQQREYIVLPDKPLPLNALDFQAAVRDYLEHSKLSVHIVGGKYGVIPEDESRSVVCLQNELAAERGDDPTFSRLIWMPAGLVAEEDRQRHFIEYLQNKSAAQKRTEILQTSLEELKTIIGDKLAANNEDPPPPPTRNGLAHIYLICDRNDIDAVAPLKRFLYDSGFEPILPLMQGDETEVREDHLENLLWCDAILIYYSNAGEFWLRQKLRDLQKMWGYDRRKPMLAQAVYVSGPQTPQKVDFQTRDALVIKNFNEFSSDSLKSFIAEIEARSKAVSRKEGGYHA